VSQILPAHLGTILGHLVEVDVGMVLLVLVAIMEVLVVVRAEFIF
jgi:hypothetical protein